MRLGQVQMAPRPTTVMPGVDGKPARPIKTAPGWAPAVPPVITYPVDNVAWGSMETPPFAAAKFYERGQAAPPPPSAPAPRAPSAIPQAAPTQAPLPTTGPLPVQDWFGPLK